jgi:hypothetical protein
VVADCAGNQSRDPGADVPTNQAPHTSRKATAVLLLTVPVTRTRRAHPSHVDTRRHAGRTTTPTGVPPDPGVN